MAETPTPAQRESSQGLPLAVALIRGRIAEVVPGRGQRAGFLHVIKLPAPDQFTSPATVEVWAPERLGERDGMWAGKVQIGGYGRTYKREVEDGRGGVRTVVVPTADNTLTALV